MDFSSAVILHTTDIKVKPYLFSLLPFSINTPASSAITDP
jgi:hypothetical protein